MIGSHGPCFLILALALAGCSGGLPGLDTIPPDSGWEPQDVNAANIRLMAAHPEDLLRGHGQPDALGEQVVPAVERLWSGHPKPLPAGEISSEASTDSGQSQPQPPAGGAQQGGAN